MVVLVAEEICGLVRSDLGNGDHLFLLGGSAARALLFHQFLEARDVNGQASFARHQLRQIERKSVGIIQLERNLRGEHSRPNVLVCCLDAEDTPVHRSFEEFYAKVERIVKAFFFAADSFFDLRLFRAQFGKDIAHC